MVPPFYPYCGRPFINMGSEQVEQMAYGTVSFIYTDRFVLFSGTGVRTYVIR